MSIEDIIAKDAQPNIDKDLSDDRLKDVSFWAEEQLRHETVIKELEEKLATAKKSHREIAEQKLPDAMRECNLSEIKLANGTKISIQQFYSARIGKEQEELAFNWLKTNGHEDIIKNVVSVQFGRGEDEEAFAFSYLAHKQGYLP